MEEEYKVWNIKIEMIKTSKSSNLSLRLPKIDSKFPLK